MAILGLSVWGRKTTAGKCHSPHVYQGQFDADLAGLPVCLPGVSAVVTLSPTPLHAVIPGRKSLRAATLTEGGVRRAESLHE